ncbi:MAG: sucrase ferredoxin [Actinomycetota bacterium]|nr:hypothetical protein [Micrococcales bacterium]MEC7001597.1 sucrase ferredoxin [Actinomycetota bacterium]MAK38536.1 hypothetical protein [Micrococcales bacterium]MEC8504428.1 sucrase ferredoxin [Actinomycetota bacterium]MEC8648664.1 sucrase ferredoxin [Actinomycetota bacterium]
MTSTDAPCSHRSVDNHEPLAGSAPSARAWIVIEHLGPWGRDALEDSGLNSDCVEHLRTALDTHGVRTILARPSGARRESAHSERGGLVPSRHVWVAACGPSAGIGRHGQMTDVSTLLQWDLEALGQGVLPNFGVPMEEAWEFVCTHGKRDVCCATSGRGYALARQAAAPDAHVRECSHLGGHRFAPTCLFLPSGRLYGRLDAAGFYPAGSEPSAEFLRGASYLSPAAQAADQAVRSALAMPANARTYLRVGPDGACENSTTVNVETADNGTWHVTCTDNTIEAPASCGAPPTVRTVWQAEIAGAPSGVHPDNP